MYSYFKLYFLSNIFLTLFIYEYNQEQKIILSSLYPSALTLLNQNIVIVSSDGIHFFSQNLVEDISKKIIFQNPINSIARSEKVELKQFSTEDEGYIMILVDDTIYFFESDGTNIKIFDLSNSINGNYYCLIPFKKENNNLYYIILYSIKGGLVLNIFKFDIYKYSNELITSNNYTVYLQSLNSNKIPDKIIGPNCIFMKPFSMDHDILSCFYIIYFPTETHSKSFDPSNNFTELTDYFKYYNWENDNVLYYISALTNNDKQKAIIYIVKGEPVLITFDFNDFFSEPIGIDSSITLSIEHPKSKGFYFRQTHEFIFSSTYTNCNNYIIIINNNFTLKSRGYSSLEDCYGSYTHSMFFDGTYYNIVNDNANTNFPGIIIKPLTNFGISKIVNYSTTNEIEMSEIESTILENNIKSTNPLIKTSIIQFDNLVTNSITRINDNVDDNISTYLKIKTTSIKINNSVTNLVKRTSINSDNNINTNPIIKTTSIKIDNSVTNLIKRTSINSDNNINTNPIIKTTSIKIDNFVTNSIKTSNINSVINKSTNPKINTTLIEIDNSVKNLIETSNINSNINKSTNPKIKTTIIEINNSLTNLINSSNINRDNYISTNPKIKTTLIGNENFNSNSIIETTITKKITPITNIMTEASQNENYNSPNTIKIKYKILIKTNNLNESPINLTTIIDNKEKSNPNKDISDYKDFYKGKYNLTNNNSLSETEIEKKIKNDITSHKIDDLLSNLIDGNKEDIIVKENKTIYQITSSYNQNNKEYNNISSIKLGECEDILKKQYNLKNSTQLLIFIINHYEEGLLIPIVEYEVYEPINNTQLDLNFCKNITINIDIPVSICETQLYKYNLSS